MNQVSIAGNCDFCKKPGIVMSQAGTLYCRHCRMSYGENLKEDILKLLAERSLKSFLSDPEKKKLLDSLTD